MTLEQCCRFKVAATSDMLQKEKDLSAVAGVVSRETEHEFKTPCVRAPHTSRIKKLRPLLAHSPPDPVLQCRSPPYQEVLLAHRLALGLKQPGDRPTPEKTVAAEAVLLSGIRSLPDNATLHLACFVFISEVQWRASKRAAFLRIAIAHTRLSVEAPS